MGEVVGWGVGGSGDDFFEVTEEFVRVRGGDEDFGIWEERMEKSKESQGAKKVSFEGQDEDAREET